MEASLVNSVRERELRAFDETKLGVKGLADSGLVDIPGIFTKSADELSKDYSKVRLEVPVIDFQGIENPERRKQIIEQVRDASEKWGFFQVVNHSFPLNVLDGMIDAMRMFHEKDLEAKKQLYSNDTSKKVRYFSSVDLYHSQTADWRDTFLLTIQPSDPIHADDLPQSCRSQTMEYLKHAYELADTLSQLLSEALGLKPDYLKEMKCTEGYTTLGGLYYPACPQPQLTDGIHKHTDSTFFSILLQDHIGGLQVLHQEKWAEAPPIAGGLVINIGDMLQIASNDRFKSVIHRAVVNKAESRISVGLFFHGSTDQSIEYGPIPELLSEKNPPIYTRVRVSDYMKKFYTMRLDGEELRNLYKVQ